MIFPLQFMILTWVFIRVQKFINRIDLGKYMHHNRHPTPFKNGRSNPPPVKEAPNISFSSGMTSQQKFHSIVESIQLSLAGKSSQQVKGCQMHPKASAKCRRCQGIIQQSKQKAQNDQKQISLSKQAFVLEEQIPEQIRLNVQNPKNHLNQKIQSNITSSSKYKALKDMKSVKQVVSALSAQQISIQAYRKGTNEDPTEFIVTLYRIIQLKPTKPQLTIMLRDNNVNIRALALIYIRIALDYEQMYAFMKTSLKDNKLINALLTVGELALRLLTEQGMDQGGLRMPRIPTRIQKAINEKLSSLKSHDNQYIQKQIGEYKAGSEKMQKIVGQNRQCSQKRSRSRQKKKARRQSSGSNSSSSSSSSSPSSSSSDQSSSDQEKLRNHQQKGQKIYKNLKQSLKQQVKQQKPLIKLPKLGQQSGPSLSIQSLKSRIQMSLNEQSQKQKKQRLLSQKYQVTQKMQSIQEDQQHQQQSDSIQKYAMN